MKTKIGPENSRRNSFYSRLHVCHLDFETIAPFFDALDIAFHLVHRDFKHSQDSFGVNPVTMLQNSTEKKTKAEFVEFWVLKIERCISCSSQVMNISKLRKVF